MQDRRYRPGDVLDDYCPRERRITDHAIVAMIDDEIRRTRCGICDAEHEYKEGKVPTPRRKTQPPALFTQVLDRDERAGAAGPAPPRDGGRHRPGAGDDGGGRPRAAAAVAAPKPAQDTARESGHARDSGDRLRTRRPARIQIASRRRFPPIVDTRDVPAAGRPGAAAPRAARVHDSIPAQSTQQQRSAHAGGQNKFRGGRRRPGPAAAARTTSGRCASAITARRQGPARARARARDQGGGGRRRRGGKKNR